LSLINLKINAPREPNRRKGAKIMTRHIMPSYPDAHARIKNVKTIAQGNRIYDLYDSNCSLVERSTGIAPSSMGRIKI
jgi:hypothetical protein